MINKKRKTQLYKIRIVEKQAARNETELKEYKEKEILEEILKGFIDSNLNHSNNKFMVKNKDICYYISDKKYDANILKVLLNYIKFNKCTKIIDVTNLSEKYNKSKNEGDEEKQHFLIKLFNKYNKGILVWEKILGAVTVGILEKEVNKYYREWIKQFDKDKKLELGRYEIEFRVIPDIKFVDELMKLKKISFLKLVVNKEEITMDEDIYYAEENVSREEFEIIYKPIPKKTFSKHKIKNYYESFKSDKETKQKIKRIVIEGRTEFNPIRLDTESMKLTKYVETKVDNDGTIDTNDIFNKYEKVVNDEFREYLQEVCFNHEIAIDIEGEEDVQEK